VDIDKDLMAILIEHIALSEYNY